MDVLLNQTDGAGLLLLLLIPIYLSIQIAILFQRAKRKRTILQQWARENGLELLENEERRLLQGPFFMTSTNGQAVFRVTVRLADGQILHGWVRFGSRMFGLLSDAVQVKWDPPRPDPPGFPVVLPAESNSSR